MREFALRAVVMATLWFVFMTVVFRDGPLIRHAVGGVVFGILGSASQVWLRRRKSST